MTDTDESVGGPDREHLEIARLHVENQQLRIELSQALQAMAAREVIEQAKGLLIGHYRCLAPQAFAVLRLLSQESNTKLRDVSLSLVELAGREGRVHYPGLDAAATSVLAGSAADPRPGEDDDLGPAGWR
jgi:hypothetical protein